MLMTASSAFVSKYTVVAPLKLVVKVTRMIQQAILQNTSKHDRTHLTAWSPSSGLLILKAARRWPSVLQLSPY